MAGEGAGPFDLIFIDADNVVRNGAVAEADSADEASTRSP